MSRNEETAETIQELMHLLSKIDEKKLKEELEEKIRQIEMSNKDPFGLNTIPYKLNLDDGIGLN